jgi:hypothetical protein
MVERVSCAEMPGVLVRCTPLVHTHARGTIR